MPDFLASLRTRDRQPELMDQPGLDEQVHAHALRSLTRINWISRTTGLIWKPIQKLVRERPPQRPLRILDVAAGGGDVVLGLARRAAAAGIDAQVDGCDINPTAIQYAGDRARQAGLRQVSFFQADVLQAPLPEGYDIVTCSLFLHHLSDSEIVRVLRAMAAASQQLVIASDLCRNRFAYIMTWVGCRLLTRSPIVHVDGPLSVAAALTVPEARDLAQQAGLTGTTFTRYFPERFLLVWSKPS
ncbi:MAG: methyltransferase domain-containing protein [Planctomycetes bacterium]|nr:methyltransferase domain-containing protein [Planctomycetota bacterium]